MNQVMYSGHQQAACGACGVMIERQARALVPRPAATLDERLEVGFQVEQHNEGAQRHVDPLLQHLRRNDQVPAAAVEIEKELREARRGYACWSAMLSSALVTSPQLRRVA